MQTVSVQQWFIKQTYRNRSQLKTNKGSTGQCTLLKQYNEPCNFYYNECDSNFFCRGVVGAANQQYFCLCRSDYYFNGTSHSCLPTSTYGGWCFNVTHCNPFANLLCLNGACSCSATQYWNGTMCVDYLLYGQPCYNQTLCNPYDANLLCMVPPLGTSQTVCYCRTGKENLFRTWFFNLLVYFWIN